MWLNKPLDFSQSNQQWESAAARGASWLSQTFFKVSQEKSKHIFSI